MKIEFHPEALVEYDEATQYYAQQQPDLDLRFILHVEEALGSIGQNPTRWGFFDENVRRCLMRVFPYRILYRIERERIYIIAVAHTSRDPEYWKHRLS
jgi:plasmid stabilization system protein ParE